MNHPNCKSYANSLKKQAVWLMHQDFEGYCGLVRQRGNMKKEPLDTSCQK